MPRAGLLPRGVGHCPHNLQRPFQARVYYRGERYSLGYYASVHDARVAVIQAYQEIEEWSEMQIPPPRLLDMVRAREERRAKQAVIHLEGGTSSPDPLPPALQSADQSIHPAKGEVPEAEPALR